MKSSTKYPIFVALTCVAIVLLSWNQLNPGKADRSSQKTSLENNFPSSFDGINISALNAENYWDKFDGIARNAPPAEDVLVQRIPGDNGHILIMAYYSKENYSGQFVSINVRGSQLVFHDDGKGDDKTAGDGLYTAKIAIDVNEFRQNAIRMNEDMKKNGSTPIRFIHRAMVVDPDKTENFDMAAMDNNEAVSIASLETTTSSSNKLLDSLRANSIFITNTKVVEDPTRTWNPCTQTGNLNGAWTFNTLMRQLASKDPKHIANDSVVSAFVKGWLNIWKNDKTLNSDLVPARPLVSDKILKPWLDKSKQNGSPSGQLNMKYAPFKLLAIVNRFDLRERFLNIPCGEARLIFCLIDSSCTKAENFTFIMEYGIPKTGDCDTLKAWAKQWYNLKNFTVGSSSYNQALQKITDQFTLCGTNVSRTNQSCLNAVRTNDRALSPSPVQCEFRQFGLNAAGDKLVETTTTNAPADRYNAQVDNPAVERMVRWINDNRRAIIDDSILVPSKFQDSPLLGAKTTILGPTVGNPEKVKVYHWDGTETKGTPTFIRNTEARHTFSLNVCSGCHAGEVQTNFTHVDPVFFGKEATLSGFLSGKAGQGGAFDFDGDPNNDSMMVEDAALRPASNPMVRMFNDILRRARDLKDVVNTSCGSLLQIRDELMFEPVAQVH